VGRTKPYKYSHHTLSGKRRLYDRKNNKDPLGEKQAIEANCRFENERSEFLYSYLQPKKLGRMGRQQGERTHYPTR